MKLFLFLSLLFVSFITPAQTFEIKKSNTSCFKEIYLIDKSTQMKCGKFLKLDKQSKDTLISGYYQNGQKTGIWRYFMKDNHLWMSYDFDKKSFLLLPPEISKTDSFLVVKGQKLMYTKVDNPPVYLGSKNEIEKVLSKEIELNPEIIANSKSGVSFARFVVGSDGKLKNITQEVMLSVDLFPQIENILKKLEEEWIPARIDGEAVDSQSILVIDIKPKGKALFPDSPRCITVHLQYAETTTKKRVIGYELRRVDESDLQDFKRSNSKTRLR